MENLWNMMGNIMEEIDRELFEGGWFGLKIHVSLEKLHS
jgi:hypothetical protein